MKDIKVIRINIEGTVQAGKSAVMASIRNMLMNDGYCVAIPNREERNNPSEPIDSCAPHERPNKDRTVIVFTETCTKY